MTLLLAKWEAEELREALRARGRLWQEVSSERFIRHTHNQQRNLYEVHLRNGQPRGMYLLSAQGDFSDQALLELVEKMTSYGQRKSVERLLKAAGTAEFEFIAHSICNVMVGDALGALENLEDKSANTDSLQTSVGTVPTPDLPKRSRYLENLLRKK